MVCRRLNESHAITVFASHGYSCGRGVSCYRSGTTPRHIKIRLLGVHRMDGGDRISLCRILACLVRPHTFFNELD